MNFRFFPFVFVLFCFFESGCSDDAGSSPIKEILDDVCHQVEQCSGESFSADGMQECHRMAMSVGMVLPDPEAFADCFPTVTCAQLLEIETNQQPILACIDLDPSSVVCQNNETLLACSNKGVCSAINCPESCRAVGANHLGCGIGSHPYDNCLCSY